MPSPQHMIAWAVIGVVVALLGATALGDPHDEWGFAKAFAGMLALETIVVGIYGVLFAFAWAVEVVA